MATASASFSKADAVYPRAILDIQLPSTMPPWTLDLTGHVTSTTSRTAMTAVWPLLSRGLGLRQLERLYRQIPAASADRFADLALNALAVTAHCADGDISHVPATGALIVVANHPHGAVDGLALASVIRRVRPDVRLLANHWLATIPELEATCFFVDPFGRRSAVDRSHHGLRGALHWLRSGHALIVFPAGEVAHDRSNGDSPRDSDWSTTVGRLALHAAAPIVPAHIAGRNSRLFYLAGRVHPVLRTCLLPRELLKKCGTTVSIRIGPAVRTNREVAGHELTALTREATDRLAVQTLDAPRGPGDEAEARAAIEREIAALPEDACLVRAGRFRVFCAPAERIPLTLEDIGRLRERTYRAVGEGTGRDIDLDAFDRTYLHLWSWDTEARGVVGAYRLGLADTLVSGDGVDALYTRTLFRYDRALLDRLGPSIELGRSFVREEYQRSHTALLLLWRGIGQFIARHPRYRVLFGPVTISAEYSDEARQLLMSFLEQQYGSGALAGLVTATHPPTRPPRPASVELSVATASTEEVSRAIASLERSGAGMPVLLRHYLKLNARLLAFNVDPSFRNALDALMMVDLTRVDPSTLSRYIGAEETARYLAHHAETTRVTQAA